MGLINCSASTIATCFLVLWVLQWGCLRVGGMSVDECCRCLLVGGGELVVCLLRAVRVGLVGVGGQLPGGRVIVPCV